MFSGYGFFDYKYNIPGYHGQDYDNGGRFLYLGISLGLLAILLTIFAIKKPKKEAIVWYLRISGIAFTLLCIIKTTWESYFDITTGPGFNVYILPLETCSMIMPCAIIAGFAKGKVKDCAEAWLVTGNIVGGISNLLFLRALLYYPFFTFGAMYSMLWHFYMVFTGLFLWITGYVKPKWKLILYAMIPHLAFSVVVIPVNYIWNCDFMLYRTAGGAPLIEDLSITLYSKGIGWLTTPIMVIVYAILFAFIVAVAMGINALCHIGREKKEDNAPIEEASAVSEPEEQEEK
ncbi:MAG: YwaF family protein [Bacilli bacterium]|nr:YwaF family protein [Bacilli bacterium]